MVFMVNYGMKCVWFVELVFGILWVILVCMDYFFFDVLFVKYLNNLDIGYIFCYVLGCDYYKVLCSKLKKLGEKI